MSVTYYYRLVILYYRSAICNYRLVIYNYRYVIQHYMLVIFHYRYVMLPNSHSDVSREVVDRRYAMIFRACKGIRRF